MPFTLAHPAVVVPIARAAPRWFVLPALVIGSMSPDFEYFVYLRPERTIGHDLVGIPLLCVPSGYVVYWLFEYVAKRPMMLLMPRTIRDRLWPLCQGPARENLGVIVLSLGLGAFSHIAWDAFTHQDGWVVTRTPVLGMMLGDRLPLYKLLQYGSTIVGLSLLGYWSLRWLRRQESIAHHEPEMRNGSRVTIVLSMFLIASGFATLMSQRGFETSGIGDSYRLGVRFVIAFLSSSCVTMLAYCAGAQIWLRHARLDDAV
jgi:hypothetical protein